MRFMHTFLLDHFGYLTLFDTTSTLESFQSGNQISILSPALAEGFRIIDVVSGVSLSPIVLETLYHILDNSLITKVFKVLVVKRNL